MLQRICRVRFEIDSMNTWFDRCGSTHLTASGPLLSQRRMGRDRANRLLALLLEQRGGPPGGRFLPFRAVCVRGRRGIGIPACGYAVANLPRQIRNRFDDTWFHRCGSTHLTASGPLLLQRRIGRDRANRLPAFFFSNNAAARPEVEALPGLAIAMGATGS